MRDRLFAPDLHIHTPFSCHARGSMEETVLAAIDKGLTEIGFADHFPYPEGYQAPAPDCVIPDTSIFEQYVSEVRRLQKIYQRRIRILLGVEIDYLPDHIEDIRQRLRSYSLDYAIGSIHILDGIVIDYREDILASRMGDLGGPEGLWKKYWKAFEHFIAQDLFQVVGHFDLPKKFGMTKVQNNFSESIGRLFDLIRAKGLVLEINTGGIDRASDRDFYPSKGTLERAFEKGVEIAFGSDAHRPEEVARHFPEALAFVRSIGYRNAISFKDQKRRYCPLQ